MTMNEKFVLPCYLFYTFFKIMGAKRFRLGVEDHSCKAEGSDGLCKNAELLSANTDAYNDYAIAA